MDQQNLKKIRHVALDMDGTIYSGSTLFPFTKSFLAQLEELGIGYTFFTNNSSKSVRDYLAHLGGFGMEIREEQMYTSTLSTIAYLRREYPDQNRAFILGTESMRTEFEEAGFIFDDENPELVIVGFDPELDYHQMCRAGYWIAEGKPFIATHPDRICPTDQPTLLIDCGAVCAALTSATGREPDAVLGKPHRIMMEEILRKHQLQPDELAVAGDRIYTDVAMAHEVGATGVLVLTGECTREEGEAADPRPHFIFESLENLGEHLAGAQTVG